MKKLIVLLFAFSLIPLFSLSSQTTQKHDNNNLWTVMRPFTGAIGIKEICGAEFPGGSGIQYMATTDHDIGFFDCNQNIIVISTGPN